jgi:hypothetical protein
MLTASRSDIEVTQIFEAGHSEPTSTFALKFWLEGIRTPPEQW